MEESEEETRNTRDQGGDKYLRGLLPLRAIRDFSIGKRALKEKKKRVDCSTKEED